MRKAHRGDAGGVRRIRDARKKGEPASRPAPLIDIAVAVDGDQQVAAAVVVDQRSRGLLVYVEAVAHGGLVVVVALVHLAGALGACGVGDGADVAALLAHAAGGQALDDDLGLDIDEQGGRQRTLHLAELGVEGHGLLHRAGEAVKDVALLAIRVRQAVLDDADDDFVGHQLALIHVFLGLQTHLRARGDGRAQHVARGDVGGAELLDELGGLRTLAGARGAQQNYVHLDSFRLERSQIDRSILAEQTQSELHLCTFPPHKQKRIRIKPRILAIWRIKRSRCIKINESCARS